jgi:hypothetical protein
MHLGLAKFILLLQALTAIPVFAAAGKRQKWYYTGQFYDTELSNVDYEGGVSNVLLQVRNGGETPRGQGDVADHAAGEATGDAATATDAAGDTAESALSLVYGGMLSSYSHHNGSMETHFAAYVEALLGNTESVTVRDTWTHKLFQSRNYASPLVIETGLFDLDA